ncbi:NlpC/P60 family protein [Streptomyces scabiei]|uniref:C40 family peptidase n=1 Tax=Streptomyces scabiei TaxID=1930 RepID=UPI00298F7F39|nr:NlpC/P60 family protein [Streptomyces scabiei]MDW8809553.1 NlpC/P60 family protein [Streptomyces scabiei]
MAPHRKPRPAGTRAGIRTPALATAALTSVALLSQTATATAAPSADDKPSLEEVEKKVGDLYRRAGSTTEIYNTAKEKTPRPKRQVETLLEAVTKRQEKLNETRGEPGSPAAAQSRTGAAAPDQASPLPADAPREHFDQNQLTDRLTDRQKEAVGAYASNPAEAAEQRREAGDSLDRLTETQNTLKARKATVQAKLARARELLSTLTVEETRLGAIEQREREEADRKAEELARQQAAQAAPQEALEPLEPLEPLEAHGSRGSQDGQDSQAGRGGAGRTPEDASTGTGTSTGAIPGNTVPAEDSAYATKAAKAIALARAQIGKPYVWGATGPGSYDCSGLTQAAWKAAGVDLPRTTHDQAAAGTTVPFADARPGDLVFFYDTIGHVGLYIGNGMMIHAPKPGTYVREESVFYDGESSVHSVVRPA